MQSAGSIRTCDVLPSLGFVEDEVGWPGARCIQFTGLKLSAIRCMNRWMVDIVLFTGVMSSSRRLSEVHARSCAEDSREAVVAYRLGPRSGGRWRLQPGDAAGLVDRRTAHRYLLPWVRRRQRDGERGRPSTLDHTVRFVGSGCAWVSRRSAISHGLSPQVL